MKADCPFGAALCTGPFIMVEILFVISVLIFAPMLTDQYPPSDRWCDSRYLVVYADHGVLVMIWRIFILLDEFYFSRLRRGNPAAKGARGTRGFRRVADYIFTFYIVIFPKHWQGRCFERLQSKG